MKLHVLTVFPDLVAAFARTSVVGRAVAAGLVEIVPVDLRAFTEDKHRSTDDTPYGGGPGMVMLAAPILRAFEALPAGTHRVLLDPSGAPFQQAAAARLAGRPEIALLCGRYEGVDDRVRRHVHEEVSLGDFVLSGGEVAAMAVIEAVVRLLPGVLGNEESSADESFARGPTLEYPQFTRPAEIAGERVPDVLVSGDHGKVAVWRRDQAIARTRSRRPDLYARLLAEGGAPRPPLYVALVHHPVLSRDGAVQTTALTNLDVHDLARTARTYGARGLFVVTPIALQRALVDRITAHWLEGPEGDRVPERRDALERVTPCGSVEEAVAAVAAREKTPPFVLTTTARVRAGAVPATRVLAESADRPLLVVFGTGHGLTAETHEAADAVLEPIAGADGYNHLSVRAAAGIVLDRIFGAPAVPAPPAGPPPTG